MSVKPLIVVAVLLGAAVAYLVDSRFDELDKKANPPTTTFFKAAVDIKPGTTFTAARGGKRPLLRPVTTIPEQFARSYPDAVDLQAVDLVKARTITRPVRAGEFLRFSDFDPMAPEELRARIPPGHVATSFQVTAQSSVGYLISPGDIIDIYLLTIAQDPKAPGASVPVTKKQASDMRVFAVDNLILRADGSAVHQRGRPYNTVTVTGPPEQILKLVAAQKLGQLVLVLKSDVREEG